ncbi:ankyrin repeat domain-containing protein [Aspergillus brunneoviolaceus CBS 621.78]|uniref:Ankyrin n=1 Tax=Aspergillus brunneoviolaceus CBS 621.78 TaxID=1450534 RepID=A0ACD1GH69_9EURO|nr:ankyrin [Aspergillus brunneoviolaceus CBS 621.78]RAH48591.1 ankyrin [Aspergillus brunneoviolaceus CBS 621.78]
MGSSLGRHVHEKVETDTTSGDLQAIRDLHQSTDSKKQPSLLAHIAARAAGKAQLEILDWVFSEGFRVAPGSLNNEFYHQACYAQSLAVWKTLVKNGLDLNGHHSEVVGDALSLAAYYGNVEIARFLLENGQDPNEAWGGYDDLEPGVAALAGKKPSVEILWLMLQHGWRQGRSAAHIAAAELGNMEALELLVEHGADLEEASGWWTNSYKGQREPVMYLLGKGANVHFRDEMGRSILWAAKQGGNEEVVELVKLAGLEDE